MKKIKPKPIKELKPIAMTLPEYLEWSQRCDELQAQMEEEQGAERLRYFQSQFGVIENAV